jgi:uncharacterized protein YjiS (DUF1127 family)
VRRSIYIPVSDTSIGSAAGASGFKKEIAMTIKSIAEKLSAWRRYRVSLRELSRLSDRELADLGIGRGDIERVARQAVRVRFFG